MKQDGIKVGGFCNRVVNFWFSHKSSSLFSQNNVQNKKRCCKPEVSFNFLHSLLRRFGSPSSGSSVQTGPPQTVRSVYLEACRQDRVVTHNAKPPTWWGQHGEKVGGQTKHSSSHHSREKGESERKTGVSATVGETESVRLIMLTGRHRRP